ncbi:hypothetical protein [Flavobacterium sp. 3HN19-14]|uniref:hypothetical protein n=1 Tax=Flavobacterium sp. 3HN19-14 TaxID=3448133 RepID=UPI003EE3657D
MKKLLLFLAILFTLSCSQSSEDTQPGSEISKLPPATQTGARKIGCLLDGVALLPDIAPNAYNCFYQFIDGDYYFSVSMRNQKQGILKSVVIGTDKLAIAQGQTLILKENLDGNASALYYGANSNNGTDELYYTNAANSGQLTITKLDYTTSIVSGTFWFDFKDNNNVVHHVTDGRFDMRFTQ